MVIYKEEMVQRKLYYSIVDEVDSILIDGPRTLLLYLVEGNSLQSYRTADAFVKTLTGRIIDPQEEKNDPLRLGDKGRGSGFYHR